MKKLGLLVIIPIAVDLFLLGRFSTQPQGSAIVSRSESSMLLDEGIVRVTRVIDGDTIGVEIGSLIEKVRYIGINAPETVDPRKPVQCFGAEASQRNKELVESKLVRLEKDVSDRDKYGRLLRFVYLPDGGFVNFELVKEGYASASAFPPDVKYAAEFVAAEKYARGAKLGLWGACSSP